MADRGRSDLGPKMKRWMFELFYLMSLAWAVSIGLTFEELSRGLATKTESGPFFCRDLLSSGGDDNAVIFSFVLCAVPLALRLIRLTKPVWPGERIVLAVVVTTVSSLLFLANLDCASIAYTIFVVPNVLLGSAVLGMFVSIPLLLGLQRRK